MPPANFIPIPEDTIPTEVVSIKKTSDPFTDPHGIPEAVVEIADRYSLMVTNCMRSER